MFIAWKGQFMAFDARKVRDFYALRTLLQVGMERFEADGRPMSGQKTGRSQK